MICALVLGVQTCALPIFIVAARKELGDAYVAQPSDAVMERMVGLGRLGRKSAKGWYDYPEGGKKHLWPGLAEMFPPAAVQPGVEAVQERLLDRKGVVQGKGVSVRIDPGGRRFLKKQK